MSYHQHTRKCDGNCDWCDCDESVRLPEDDLQRSPLMSATLHTKSAGDAPDDTAKLLRASVEMERMRSALEEIAAMTFDPWTNGAIARDIAVAVLAKAQGGAA